MEKTTDHYIVADSSALVSLANETDRNHARAVAEGMYLARDQRVILLPADILVETLNVPGRKIDHHTARKTAAELLKPGGQFVLVETRASWAVALAKFAALPKAVSFTDCLVMAVADTYRTRDIFGFDEQFTQAGYHRLVPAA